MEKLYRRQKLDEALAEAGIVSVSVAYRWILKQEAKGNLVCPRNPSNHQRAFTLKDIQDIIKAYSPAGQGKYIYKK